MKDRAEGPDRLRTNGSLTHERYEPSRRIEMRRVHRHPVPRAERATGAAERGPRLNDGSRCMGLQLYERATVNVLIAAGLRSSATRDIPVRLLGQRRRRGPIRIHCTGRETKSAGHCERPSLFCHG